MGCFVTTPGSGMLGEPGLLTPARPRASPRVAATGGKGEEGQLILK